MEVIDAQIHVWEPDHHGRPWNREFADPRRVFLEHGPAPTIESAVDAMDAIGVDAAVVTSLLLYRDIDYAVEAAVRYPERFCVVPQIDISVPHPERLVAEYRDRPGVVAVRLSHVLDREEYYRGLRDGVYEPIFTAAATYELPVMLMVWGNVLAAEPVVRLHPELQFIIDHLGIVQGPSSQPPDDPFARLDELLSLAKFPNVAVKVTGVPAVSKQAYPYSDLWPHLHRVIDAFGAERLMWGSDFARTRPLHTYADALSYIKDSDEISPREKELILGETIRKLLNWPRDGVGA